MLEIRSKTHTMESAEVVDTLPKEGGWVELTQPTERELAEASEILDIPIGTLRAPLDDEEHPRIDASKDFIFIILDVPHLERDLENTLVYQTYPLGIFLTSKGIATVSLYETGVIRAFREGTLHDYAGRVEDFSHAKQGRFSLQIVREIAAAFVSALRRIDDMSLAVERRLHQSMRNEELIQMLSLGKSLVYFSTSLKSNQTVLRRMLRLPQFSEHEEDADLLEDVLIETEQAIEMADIYMNILNSTMDAFASVISNNLNVVMKVLTSATIVITIPTLFAGLWGMNVPVPWAHEPWAFLAIIVLSVAVAGTLGWWLKKKNFF